MKVNMTPNPLDVVTIHASQGDTEARQWEFELHNNGELIDTSDVQEQMFFKAYKGGTEQLLPENTSTPTTSPFLGDIKYPQGLLTDQEFLYRESPTEEDGLAKITDIKGNTLNWNQLMENGNFADTSKWEAESGATLSISNNIATVSSTTANNGIKQYFPIPLTVGHKYLIKAEFNVPTEYRCVIGTAANQGVQTDKLISTANTWTEVIGIGTCTVATTTFYCFVRGTTYENVKIRNVMCFDITAMGLDISSPSDFTSLFSLPYYSYNQGTLLSFNGNGIKTTGVNNMFGVAIRNNTNWIYQYASNRAIFEFDVEPSTQYTLKVDYSSNVVQVVAIYKEGYANYQISNMVMGSGVKEFTITTPSNCRVLCLQFESNASVTFTDNDFPNRNSWYCLKDPSQISTLSLPISTYFPNGMKSAGSVCDELTETKAITRIGAVDLGTLTWQLNGTRMQADIGTTFSNWNYNQECAKYTSNEAIAVSSPSVDKIMGVYRNRILIYDSSFADPTAFKTAMNGIPLYFELSAYEETSFTTASLVTENAEIPLSNEDGVLIGKCTEELSAQPGFIDAKIKLTDGDGTCYSNKIQLHVERKP